MVKYTEEQVRTLKELRMILFEHGFEIHNIVRRYRKHELEFVAVKKDGTTFESAVVRLWRGRVKVQFLEAVKVWSTELMNTVLALYEKNKKDFAPIFFGKKFRNHHESHLLPFYWYEFVYQHPLKKQGLENAIQQLKNAGIRIQKGSRAL
ncbi:MAG: hypothetical protein HYT27_03010 [Parcubacteria group bacterium]|nr:hypothetical protein [Parcubacteria group bacterium]